MRWVAAGCLVVMLAMLAGCGGGGGNSAPIIVPETGVGRAVFTIKWPAVGAVNAPQSLVLAVQQTGTTLSQQTINRPAQGTTSPATFNNLPAGDLVFHAEAHAGADGGGAVRNSVTGGLHITKDGTTNLTITLTADTIDHLALAPAAPVVEVGQVVQLTATPQDANGEVVLVPPDHFEWSSDNVQAAMVDDTGLVTGISAGAAHITVRERVSGKTATVTVSVRAVAPPPVSGTGGAVFTITWPSRGRAISRAPESLVIAVQKAGQVVATQTANHPATGTSSQVTFSNLPVGDLLYHAQAFAGADGAGALVGEVQDTLRITANASTAVALTLTSTVDHMEIAPSSAVVDAKKTVQLAGTPKTATGAVVMVDPSELRWSSNNPAIATVDGAGLVTGVHYGTARITVSEPQSGKAATAVVTVRYGQAPSPWDSTLQQGQQHLEQVTTNLTLDPATARQELALALSAFNQVLQYESDNVRAKWGVAMAQSLLARYELAEVLPSWIDIPSLTVVTPLGASRTREAFPFALPRRAAQRTRVTRAAAGVSAVQERAATQTLPALTQALPLFDDVASAVRYGADIRLRMALDGGVRTVIFDHADVQLLNTHGHAVAALLNFGIAFNAAMPTGTPVQAAPLDANHNGFLDAEEYLIPAPFFNASPYHSQAMSAFLRELREAGVRAQQGGALNEHTVGPNALIDVNNASVRADLSNLARSGAGLTLATSMSISTGALFSDGVSRRVDLQKLTTITSLRAILPSFPVGQPNTPGYWADPTFNGAITPSAPNDFLTMTYAQMEHSF